MPSEATQPKHFSFRFCLMEVSQDTRWFLRGISSQESSRVLAYLHEAKSKWKMCSQSNAWVQLSLKECSWCKSRMDTTQQDDDIHTSVDLKKTKETIRSAFKKKTGDQTLNQLLVSNVEDCVVNDSLLTGLGKNPKNKMTQLPVHNYRWSPRSSSQISATKSRNTETIARINIINYAHLTFPTPI